MSCQNEIILLPILATYDLPHLAVIKLTHLALMKLTNIGLIKVAKFGSNKISSFGNQKWKLNPTSNNLVCHYKRAGEFMPILESCL